jgi:hypothetical protein
VTGHAYTVNSLIEQPAVPLFGELGWEAAEFFGIAGENSSGFRGV